MECDVALATLARDLIAGIWLQVPIVAVVMMLVCGEPYMNQQCQRLEMSVLDTTVFFRGRLLNTQKEESATVIMMMINFRNYHGGLYGFVVVVGLQSCIGNRCVRNASEALASTVSVAVVVVVFVPSTRY